MKIKGNIQSTALPFDYNLNNPMKGYDRWAARIIRLNESSEGFTKRIKPKQEQEMNGLIDEAQELLTSNARRS